MYLIKLNRNYKSFRHEVCYVLRIPMVGEMIRTCDINGKEILLRVTAVEHDLVTRYADMPPGPCVVVMTEWVEIDRFGRVYNDAKEQREERLESQIAEILAKVSEKGK